MSADGNTSYLFLSTIIKTSNNLHRCVNANPILATVQRAVDQACDRLYCGIAIQWLHRTAEEVKLHRDSHLQLMNCLLDSRQ